MGRKGDRGEDKIGGKMKEVITVQREFPAGKERDAKNRGYSYTGVARVKRHRDETAVRRRRRTIARTSRKLHREGTGATETPRGQGESCEKKSLKSK